MGLSSNGTPTYGKACQLVDSKTKNRYPSDFEFISDVNTCIQTTDYEIQFPSKSAPARRPDPAPELWVGLLKFPGVISWGKFGGIGEQSFFQSFYNMWQLV